MKTAKLSINLSSAEGKLKAIYVDIGKMVHEIYRHGGTLGGDFDEKYNSILEAEAKIADIKTRIELAKGNMLCPHCDSITKVGSVFCPKCGFNYGEDCHDAPSDVPRPATIANVDDDDIWEEEVIGKVCNLCQYENHPSERFCLSCGRAL